MTAEEVCEKYNVSLSSLKTKFSRTQKAILKNYGVQIDKIGRGDNTVYEETDIYSHAVTMYDELKDDIIIDRSTIKFESVEFNCFLAIILTKFMTFRGTYEDFLKYMGLKVTKANIEMITDAINALVEKGIVNKYDDKSTNEGYFILSLVRKAEVEMKIGITMIKNCKEIAEKNGKRDYIKLLKTWLGMQIMSEEQPFTMKMLENVTGLSEKTLRANKKLLEKNDYFKTTKAYTIGCKCLGQNVDINVFKFYPEG